MHIKTLISDFDFTLNEHSDPTIFHENLAAIREWRKAGNQFVVATGRGRDSLLSAFPDCDEYADYCVLCDGAMLTGLNGRVIYSDHLSPHVLEGLGSALENLDYDSSHALICFDPDAERPYIGYDTCKIRFWGATEDDCLKVENLLYTDFAATISYFDYHNVKFNDDTERLSWVTPEMGHLIEINAKGTNKRTGIDRLKQIANLEDIITIGDGKNDICMIRAYDGYVVERASNEVKSAVSDDHVVPHLCNLVNAILSS